MSAEAVVAEAVVADAEAVVAEAVVLSMVICRIKNKNSSGDEIANVNFSTTTSYM